MKRQEHHVVPNSDRGGWDVVRSNSDRASKHFDVKQDAIDYGRQVSKNQKTEFVIHNRDGRISNADSHGHDPNPPRDKQ